MPMALRTPYLAADNAGMERRARALHRFLVASPIALLIAVGLVAHLRKPPFPHPAGSAAYDRNVLAYRDRVAEVARLRKLPAGAPNAEAEARKWVAGYRSGELVAVPSAFYEDRLRDGVRGEVVRAGVALSSEVAQRAEQSLRAGDAPRAAELALLASETAFGFRRFEFQAYLQSLLGVRRGLGTVIEAWPALPEEKRAALRPRIAALRIDAAEVDGMAEAARDNLRDYLRRQKVRSLEEMNDPRIAMGPEVQEEAAAKRSLKISNARVAALAGPGGKP